MANGQRLFVKVFPSADLVSAVWLINNLLVSSPRLWGCFWRFNGGFGVRWIFPTLVGVFPS